MSGNRRGIDARDEREFKYGEIYRIKDSLVDFPESQIVQRTYHWKRLLVITQHCNSNYDKNIWTLNAAPCSSQINMKRDTDLEIEPATGNYINKKTLIRLGTAQPFLKIDLEGPIGELTTDQKKMMAALQVKLAGVL
ncbi:hydrogenase [Neobacillus notoginsengisoli]|uniref:Hydrogenase n=1 Tax=Neobacillus notoginsengisoli TaxID=1578198 RepID=A0A417YFJ3_9BACI|nr:hydrogenase [Neobacillus notoginsengisoli]RHW31490.1 hydrogenase [Neobacillus notoginsengisoli]